MSIARQYLMLGISRSGFYREPVRDTGINQQLKRLIKDIHDIQPSFGSRRISDVLEVRGHKIGRYAVRTLMRELNVKAVYPKPRLSKSHPEHKKYPYA